MEATPIRPEAIDGESVGMLLRTAREARGLPIEAIAEHTRVPIRHLQAIEQGAFADLPALPYSTGFVKTYADRVGLDGQEMSRRFRAEVQALATAEERYEPYEPVDPARVPPRALAIAGVVLAVLLAVGFLLWRGLPGQEELSRTAAADPGLAAPVSVPPAAGPVPPAQPAASGPVVLAADRDVWMKVNDGQRTLFTGVLAAGKTFPVPVDAADPRIQTGRPEGLVVTVGGRPVAPLGPEATLVKDLSLQPAALLARPAGPPAGAAPSSG